MLVVSLLVVYCAADYTVITDDVHEFLIDDLEEAEDEEGRRLFGPMFMGSNRRRKHRVGGRSMRKKHHTHNHKKLTDDDGDDDQTNKDDDDVWTDDDRIYINNDGQALVDNTGLDAKFFKNMPAWHDVKNYYHDNGGQWYWPDKHNQNGPKVDLHQICSHFTFLLPPLPLFLVEELPGNDCRRKVRGRGLRENANLIPASQACSAAWILQKRSHSWTFHHALESGRGCRYSGLNLNR